MDERDTTQFKPPYMSFQTFWNFISELCANPLPPQIDRSIMNSKSGSDQSNLIAAMKSFGLIDEDQRVQDDLTLLALAPDEDHRKQQLASLVRRYYPKPVEVSNQNGTEKQLHDAFFEAYGLDGDTRRKAVTFFLHAARAAGLDISPYFPKTRSGQGSPGTPRAKPKRRSGAASMGSGTTASRPRRGGGDTYTVELRSGEGTISVVVDVNLFELSPDDMKFVIGLVEKLKGYDEAQNGEPGGAAT